MHYALIGTETLYREGLAYKKAGVMMLKLVDEHIQQLHLWDDRDRERYGHLMVMLDGVNQQMGQGTLRYAIVPTNPSWLARCDTNLN